MDSVDFSVLKTLQQWKLSGLPLWLVTVVQTFGSSPRPPGAMLVLRADGVMVGSVSGGCIEDDLASRSQSGTLPTGQAETLTYGVTRDEALRFGLPCGGALKLVVEPVQDFDWVDAVLHRIGQQQLALRTLQLHSLEVSVEDASSDSTLAFDGSQLRTVYGPRWRLLIIGAGQTSTYLAQMALALDYQVLVCDPREEMREAWNVPESRLIADMPDDAVTALQVDASTAVVALTHDPKLDDMALLEALKTPAFYVGALGSKSNNAKRRERLAMFDLSREEIDRLHGPVGLSIGSRTPPEIAVAILAHMIAVRNASSDPSQQHNAQQHQKETCS